MYFIICYQPYRINQICQYGYSFGDLPFVIKFYFMIPRTTHIQPCLLLSSGNNLVMNLAILYKFKKATQRKTISLAVFPHIPKLVTELIPMNSLSSTAWMKILAMAECVK